jgi:hypothetical protein
MMMATGIVSAGMRQVGQAHLGGGLLAVALVGFGVLAAASAWRVCAWPGVVRGELTAPERTFASLVVLAARFRLREVERGSAARLRVPHVVGAAAVWPALGAWARTFIAMLLTPFGRKGLRCGPPGIQCSYVKRSAGGRASGGLIRVGISWYDVPSDGSPSRAGSARWSSPLVTWMVSK